MTDKNDLPIWLATLLLALVICGLAIYFSPASVQVRESQARLDDALQLASEMQLEVDQFSCINGGECRAPAAR